MTIDWDAVARRLNYKSEREMWVALYEGHGLSITQLTTQFGVTRSTIHKTLRRNHIKIRGRGGPNNQQQLISLAEARQIRREGIRAASRRLHIPYPTLYRRVRIMLATVGETIHDEDDVDPGVEA